MGEVAGSMLQMISLHIILLLVSKFINAIVCPYCYTWQKDDMISKYTIIISIRA